MKNQNVRSINRRAIIGHSLLLVVVTGGSIWWTWQTAIPTFVNQQPAPTQAKKLPVYSSQAKVVPSQTAQATVPVPVDKSTYPVKLQPEAYWLRVDSNQIRLLPERVALNPAVSPQIALTKALNHLLSNSQASNLTTTIPAGTRLLNLQVTSTGIYVNLSHEFSQGGGTMSMIYRVAQVLYTATSLDSSAKVYLLIEGQLLDENHPLGGEGLMLRQPLTRQQFAQDFSLS
jgi:spore germination protein GerM